MTAPTSFAPPLVVKRVLAAPARSVWRVWTEPRFLTRWNWGRDHETLSVSIDLRVGGLWKQQVRNVKNDVVWTFDGEFREVDPARRLVHTFHWVSDQGEDHGTSVVAIDFHDRGAECEIVLTHTEIANETIRSGTVSGWADVIGIIAEVAAVNPPQP
jgi:uncharacterized protein YndB with AHSA1/START domain